MKTTDGFWVSYDNRNLTDFDFFIRLLRAVDDKATIRLAYRPERSWVKSSEGEESGR